MDVHARCEQDIAAIFENLVTDALAHFFHKFLVPGASESGAYGETGCIEGLRSGGTCGVDAHTGRAIGHHGGRNSKTGDGLGHSGGSRYEVGVHTDHIVGIGVGSDGSLAALAYAKRGFFFERHCLEDFFHVVGVESEFLCLYAPCHEAEDGCYCDCLFHIIDFLYFIFYNFIILFLGQSSRKDYLDILPERIIRQSGQPS